MSGTSSEIDRLTPLQSGTPMTWAELLQLFSDKRDKVINRLLKLQLDHKKRLQEAEELLKFLADEGTKLEEIWKMLPTVESLPSTTGNDLEDEDDELNDEDWLAFVFASVSDVVDFRSGIKKNMAELEHCTRMTRFVAT